MKKTLLALCAVAAFSASAVTNEYSPIPGEGALNPNDYSGGIGSVEINCTAEINRECTGFATLSKGKNVIKAIPASNVRMVYCVDGFSKVTTGTPHISFFEKNDSPAAEPGDYTVVIPSNFIKVNGVGNAPLEYHYTVLGSAVKISPIPADRSTISELSTFKLKFDKAEQVKFNGDLTSINIEYADPNDDEKTITIDATDVTVDGTEATITFPTYTTPGSVMINVNAGAFTSKSTSGSTERNASMMIRYFIAPAVVGVFSISPAPSTITSLKPYQIVDGTYATDYYFFNVGLPEGYTFQTLNARKAALYKELPDGSLESYQAFSTWKANEDKTAAGAYLQGDEYDRYDELKLAPGTYWFVIPANGFYIKDADANVTPCQELKFGPYIVEGEPAKYTVSPSADDHVTSLTEIVITFEDATKVEVNPIAWFTLNNDTIEYDMRGEAEGNKVVITIEPAINVVGEYTLVSDSSNITVDGAHTAVEATFIVERGFINEVTILNNGKPADAQIVEDEDFGSIWAVNVEAALPIEGLDVPATGAITFELPFGYDSVYALENLIDTDAVQHRVSVEEITAAGLKKLENNTLSDLTLGEHIIMFTYAAGDEALEPSFMRINVAENTLTSVEEINVAEEAEYYTLQGVKVENPEKGIYIKVVNGKASKVNL
ncbi:MAG: hypothetical protein K2M31_04090 [Muribaculaceae bacterium]|nr:hypothetical protein [Muribaculaceae bacterium]